ncbi:MAG: hypothetical protein HGA44_10645 [Cellulomonadaceae bacterium]|nr:hypothetical protein [Cellulomonadaceae bacterium]
MGRHAAPAPEPPDDAPEPGPLIPVPEADDHLRTSRPPLRDVLVLALVAGIATGGVTAWAGAQVWAAVLGAVGAAAVVLVASWVATTVPGRTHPLE